MVSPLVHGAEVGALGAGLVFVRALVNHLRPAPRPATPITSSAPVLLPAPVLSQPAPDPGPKPELSMSILTDLIHGKITFQTAAAEAGQWAQKIVASNPQAAAFAATSLSAVKQGASNMIALADTELAQHYAQVVGAVEAGADAALMGATGGKALPAVPMVNGTIEQIAAAGKVALDAWAMQAKANLTPANPVQAESQ